MKNWKTSATTKAMAWLCGLLCYSSTLVSSVLYLFVRIWRACPTDIVRFFYIKP